MAKDSKPFVRPPIKEDKPAPKPTPPKPQTVPVPPSPEMSETDKMNIMCSLNGRRDNIKRLLVEAKTSKDKDRLQNMLDDLEKDVAEWKKKGVTI